jgi:hypothetical protein
MTQAFCLSVEPGQEVFRPEIEYVLSVLQRHYPLRLVGPAEKDAPLLHYGASADGAAVVVPGTFFARFAEIRESGGIFLSPGAADRLLARDGGFLPPEPEGNDPGGALSYDAIGLAFLMLSRVEERDCGAPDRYGRYPAEEAFAVRAGLHAVPLADRALDDIARRLLQRTEACHIDAYQAVPTHDVDGLKGYHRAHEPLRYALGDALKRGRPVRALRRLAAYGAGEPARSFDWLMRLSERHGLVSNFYFMAPSRHPMDSSYARRSPALLRRMAAQVRARGHRIGFHPGFDTYDNAEEWQRQRADLEQLIDVPLTEGRQHVLRYAADATPRLWSEAGMAVDHTPAFPEVPGFRTGSTRRNPAYDLRARRPLAVDLCSTAVMEFGLFGGKYRDLDAQQALGECRPLIAACRRYGGRFVFLQHTGTAAPVVREFYHQLIAEAA